jgi:hypothetical protein
MRKEITYWDKAFEALKRIETVIPKGPSGARFGAYSKYTDSYEPFAKDIQTVRETLESLISDIEFELERKELEREKR